MIFKKPMFRWRAVGAFLRVLAILCGIAGCAITGGKRSIGKMCIGFRQSGRLSLVSVWEIDAECVAASIARGHRIEPGDRPPCGPATSDLYLILAKGCDLEAALVLNFESDSFYPCHARRTYKTPYGYMLLEPWIDTDAMFVDPALSTYAQKAFWRFVDSSD